MKRAGRIFRKRILKRVIDGREYFFLIRGCYFLKAFWEISFENFGEDWLLVVEK